MGIAEWRLLALLGSATGRLVTEGLVVAGWGERVGAWGVLLLLAEVAPAEVGDTTDAEDSSGSVTLAAGLSPTRGEELWACTAGAGAGADLGV